MVTIVSSFILQAKTLWSRKAKQSTERSHSCWNAGIGFIHILTYRWLELSEHAPGCTPHLNFVD